MEEINQSNENTDSRLIREEAEPKWEEVDLSNEEEVKSNCCEPMIEEAVNSHEEPKNAVLLANPYYVRPHFETQKESLG